MGLIVGVPERENKELWGEETTKSITQENYQPWSLEVFIKNKISSVCQPKTSVYQNKENNPKNVQRENIKAHEHYRGKIILFFFLQETPKMQRNQNFKIQRVVISTQNSIHDKIIII